MSTDDLINYNDKCFGLFGLGNIVKLAHLPFITSNDALGVVALEGSSGTGKTTLISRIGQLNKLAGGGDYGVYSADKVKYEDFVGIPVPNMEHRSVDILAMPNSISTKEVLLIDEANRASYDAQEKFLQLFSTRKIDGLDVACRYMYVAMNPVLSEDENDNYEGVQPLDKAYGERVQALITMPSFHNASKAQQLAIMKSCFNQVNWVPDDHVVSLHKRFLESARENYEVVKSRYLDGICEYVHTITDLIHNENRGAIKLQARRVQFLLVNLVAVHALNLVTNTKASLIDSAIESLGVSFPQRLWEQQIEFSQIKAAHDNAANILKDMVMLSKGSKTSSQSIESLLSALVDDVEKGKSDLEDRSKRVNQMIPDKDVDPFKHYMFAFSIVKTMEDMLGTDLESQNIIKRNEFERISRIAEKVRSTTEYKRSKKVAEKIRQSGDRTKVPPVPAWLDPDIDTVALDLYNNGFDDEFIWYVSGAIELSEPTGKFDDLSFRLLECLTGHNKILNQVSNLIQVLETKE